MEDRKNNDLGAKNSKASDDQNRNLQAHREAEKDIQNDLETSAHSPNDDLDEGELARLGDDKDPVG